MKSRAIDPVTILFRCDGTAQTGLGHTSRCLALAEAFTDLGCRSLFLGTFEGTARALLDAARMPVHSIDEEGWSSADARAMAAIARAETACGIVIDSYLVGPDYPEQVEGEAGPVLLIDDFASLARYRCSALLNFTVRAEALPYPRERVRCFLGPKYFAGRRSLRELRVRGVRPVGPVHRVLVATGGNDLYDIAVPALDALLATDRRLSVHVVVGARYPDRPALDEKLARFAGKTSLLSELPDLSGEFGWADLCISGAGLTKYEAAYVGMPSGVISQNAGQAKDTVCFAALGATLDLGPAWQIDSIRFGEDVRRLVLDRSFRESLQAHSVACFPPEPARDLALAALSEVFRASPGQSGTTPG